MPETRYVEPRQKDPLEFARQTSPGNATRQRMSMTNDMGRDCSQNSPPTLDGL